jgi:hydrogenase maturation protease
MPSLLKPVLVLCLGNEIISDDAFGPAVARELVKETEIGRRADVIFAPLAGFSLLDLLAGRRKVLIVDTVRTGKSAPGTLHSFPAGVLTPSHHLTSSHQISLPTALELGKRLGYAMPEHIDILAVEAQDLETLSEQLTPPVRAALPAALRLVREWIERNSEEETSDES